MTEDYKDRVTNNAPKGRSKPKGPGIAWFLAGALFGVSLIALAWFKFAPSILKDIMGTDATTETALPAHLNQSANTSNEPTVTAAKSETPSKSATPSKLQFEYQDVLRNTTVEVPKQNPDGSPARPKHIPVVQPAFPSTTNNTPAVTEPSDTESNRSVPNTPAVATQPPKSSEPAKAIQAQPDVLEPNNRKTREEDRATRRTAKRSNRKTREYRANRRTAKRRNRKTREDRATRRTAKRRNRKTREDRATRRTAKRSNRKTKKDESSTRRTAKRTTRPTTRTSASKKQLGAFANSDNARRLKAQLALRGIETKVKKVKRNNRVMHIVIK